MDLLYELWLHDICSFNAKKVDKYLYYFDSAYNAFHSKVYSLTAIAKLGFSAFSSEVRNLDRAKRIIADCKEKDIRIITINDEEYPALLKHIYLPPRILFAKGSLKNLNASFPVTFVGTRTSTAQGKLFTNQIVERLVKNNNIMIISGMAEGIDAEAHLGALKGGAPTVAVLAGGVDIIYPRSNRSLYYKILENGAVISEQPPGTVGRGYFYNQRNRIVAGMSYGTVIVEADLKSGCKLTLNHALDNNRDIFAVPSNPLSVQSQLPTKLLKDGAIILENEFDIINQYCEIYPEYFNINSNNNKTETKHSSLDNLSDDEKNVVTSIINCGGEANAENMAAELDIPVGRLNGILTVLCLKDVLCQQSQSQYLLKEA